MTQPPWGAPPQPWRPPGQPVPPPQGWPAPATGQPAWPQQFGWQAPPTGGGGWPAPQPQWQPPQPPPPRYGLRAVVLGLLVAFGLGFFGLILVGVLLAGSVGPSTPEPTPPVVPTATAGGTPPATQSRAPSTPPTASPAPTPTAGPTTPATPKPTPKPKPTPTPQPTRYDPPDLPYPKDVAQATKWTRSNPLYLQRAPVTDCALQRYSTDRPPKKLATLDKYLTRALGCLVKVWQKPVTDAGFALYQPPVRSYDKPITTACGDSPPMDSAAAFYCGGDQRIYYGVNRDRPLYYTTPLAIEGVLAHELGHAIQGRTGILWAETVLAWQADSEKKALEYSRRLELQAHCMAGVTMNALAKATKLTKEERRLLAEDMYSRGDREGYPRDHGSADNQRRWMETGLGTRDLAACNTFTAAAKRVA